MTGSGAGSMMVEPPIPKYDPEQYIKEAKKISEKYNLGAMPEYAQEEVRKMVMLPIEGPELDEMVSAEADRSMRNLEVSRTEQLAQVDRNFRNANAANTPDHVRARQMVNNAIAEEQTLLQQEARAQVLTRAYETKRYALDQVMRQGEYDSRLALELAQMIGTEDELMNAIEADDYAQFQQAMADIFGAGLEQVMTNMMKKEV